MIRPELHKQARMPDALSHTPARPHLDSVAWKRRQAEIDRRAASQAAELMAKLEQARPAPSRASAA